MREVCTIISCDVCGVTHVTHTILRWNEIADYCEMIGWASEGRYQWCSECGADRPIPVENRVIHIEAIEQVEP